MPGRASTRALCTSSGALTTTVTSTRVWASVSNNNGISSTANLAPCLSCSRRKSISAVTTIGCTMDSSSFSFSGAPATSCASSARSTLPSRTAPGNAAAIAGTASPS
jgi:hypothetical protein